MHSHRQTHGNDKRHRRAQFTVRSNHPLYMSWVTGFKTSTAYHLSFVDLTMESVLHAIPILFVAAVLSVFVQIFLDWKKGRTRGLPLPPGPKGWPIIGNMFNVPASQPWMAYQSLAVEYGALLASRGTREYLL